MAEKLAYEVHEGRGPHALFICGAMATRSIWALNTGPLRHVCRPVVVEMWGHGRSPTPSDVGVYGAAGYADALEAIRAELGLDTWFLFGQSLGASLAIHLAIETPLAVRGLIIANDYAASLRGGEIDHMLSHQASRSGQLRGPAGKATLGRYLNHPARAGYARDIAPDVRLALIREWDEIDPVGVANTAEITVPGVVGVELSKLSVPTLLVHGTREKPFAVQAERLAAEVASIEVVEVAAGHVVNVEAARAFNGFAAQFLRRHS